MYIRWQWQCPSKLSNFRAVTWFWCFFFTRKSLSSRSVSIIPFLSDDVILPSCDLCACVRLQRKGDHTFWASAEHHLHGVWVLSLENEKKHYWFEVLFRFLCIHIQFFHCHHLSATHSIKVFAKGSCTIPLELYLGRSVQPLSRKSKLGWDLDSWPAWHQTCWSFEKFS